jgi:hypothetical protein
MKRIRDCMRRLFSSLSARLSLPQHMQLKAIDITDVFPKDMREILEPGKNMENFILFFSPEDYNREIMHIFERHWKAFYLDRSHWDGHFRV